MLYKHFYAGKTRQGKAKFRVYKRERGEIACSDYTFPFDVCDRIRTLLTQQQNKVGIKGWRQCFYLQQPRDNKDCWKIIVGVWEQRPQRRHGEIMEKPYKVVAVTVDRTFTELYKDKKTNSYVKVLNADKMWSYCERNDVWLFY